MARRSRVGWWTEIASMRVLDLWQDDARLRQRVSNCSPELADALNVLLRTAEEGPPQCSAQWPIAGLETEGEFEPPIQCQRIFGHQGNHHHEFDDGGTFEWGPDVFVP